MKRNLLFTVCFFIAVIAHSQQLWKEENVESQRDYLNRNSSTLPDQVRFYTLNVLILQDRMRSAGSFDAGVSAARLEFPLPDGSFIAADVYESSIMAPQMQALIPNVRTYILVDPVSKSSLGRITIHDNNITGLIFSGKGTVYINPVDAANSKVHITYYTREVHYPLPVVCGVTDQMNSTGTGTGNAHVYSGDCHLRSYRLAVAATGEYYVWAGSTIPLALSYIAITVNTINAIYERDATVHFNLIPNDNLIVYTDSLTDPYPTQPFPNGTTLNNNNSFTDAAIGAANYDVGIVFSKQWNGGLAQLSSVCGASHARAAAGLDFGTGSNPTPGPQGPIFDGTAAHEIGHQFSATHTMVANNGQCGPNVTISTAWEPGGGSTLMAYAGTCSPNSYQNNSDLYFHVGNVGQIDTFVTMNAGNACPTNTALSNVAPTVSVAAASYIIPVSTPFILTCSANDLNGNSLTYTWEQMNPPSASTGAPPSAAAISGPNFRSFPPGPNPTRYLPNLPSVLAGLTPAYEKLPAVTRSMIFRVDVRDNAAGGGCHAQEDITVNTNAAAGPFTVTSQNSPTSLTADGVSTFTVTWNVANSDMAPVNCANVDILFSADGGQNFNYTLLANTPNDGTQTLNVPNIVTGAGRIMVKSVGNIFFNVNLAPISISSGCGAEGASLSPSSTVNASPGNSNLNLSSVPTFGTVLMPVSGTNQSSGDPISFLAVFNTVTSGCSSFGGNQYRYESYSFQVNVAGSYTFTKPAGNYVVNVYSGAFNPSNPCTNFMNSSTTYNGSTATIGNSVTVSLLPGIPYTLTIGTFNASTPAIPFGYTVSMTAAPGGGNVYSGYPNPGGAFSYRYVIVNNATGNIVAISTTPDLRTFPAGNYTVYGFSFLTANFNAATLNSYINQPLSTLTNDLLNNPAARCGNLSKNSVAVNIFMVLPVKLLPLTAVWDNQDVKLYWSTAQETGSKSFDIERSADGQTFSYLKSIPAAINSDLRINYLSNDPSPLPDKNYYRIKAVDMDGKFAYSNIALVKKMVRGFEIKIYPNPVKDVTTIEILAARNGSANLELIDAAGSRIYRKTLNWKKGMNIEPVDMQRFPAGIYHIQIISETDIISQKIIKL